MVAIRLEGLNDLAAQIMLELFTDKKPHLKKMGMT
jgi:hypothetical protein